MKSLDEKIQDLQVLISNLEIPDQWYKEEEVIDSLVSRCNSISREIIDNSRVPTIPAHEIIEICIVNKKLFFKNNQLNGWDLTWLKESNSDSLKISLVESCTSFALKRNWESAFRVVILLFNLEVIDFILLKSILSKYSRKLNLSDLLELEGFVKTSVFSEDRITYETDEVKFEWSNSRPSYWIHSKIYEEAIVLSKSRGEQEVFKIAKNILGF